MHADRRRCTWIYETGNETASVGCREANLAYWTGQAGEADGARDQYAALLPISQRSWALSTRRPWLLSLASPTGSGRQPESSDQREVAPYAYDLA
jgi:hypothetical protein